MDITDKKYKLKSAKTHKGRVHIQKCLPKLIEDPKRCAFLNTANSSEMMRMVMNEFHSTRKSYSIKLGKKNTLGCVFEKADEVEYFAEKNDAALYIYSSESKKRPMNLVFGSLFQHKILDSFEFEVSNFIPKEYFKTIAHFEHNSQPLLIFQGEAFETDSVMERFKRHMLDFYAQDLLQEVNISDLRRVIVFNISSEKKIKIRNYEISPVGEYDTNNAKIEEVGPSFDLVPRRNIVASEEDYKKVCKQPKLISTEHAKNRINSMLDVQGKLYTSRQNLGAASLKRYDKILGRKRKVNEEALSILKERKEKRDQGDSDLEDDGIIEKNYKKQEKPASNKKVKNVKSKKALDDDI